MVPMCSMTSWRLMPMPLSATVIVRASLSKLTRIRSGPSASGSSDLASSSSRSRSMASEAFEISSRRKISLLLYSECTIRSRIWTTSAWKLKLSCSVCALTAGTLDQMEGVGKLAERSGC